jgi:hypothetical protein
MAIGLQTYTDTSRREDLLSILKDVSPIKDVYLFNRLGDTTADNTYHEWPVRHISRATSVTFRAEGAAATVVDHTAPTRSGNYTGILHRVVQITGSQAEADTATGKDPMTDQKEIAMKQLTQDIEWALINGGAYSSGASGTARSVAGLDGTISTHVTARASGTSVSVTELEDIMEEVWTDVGAGFGGSTLLVPMGINRTISGFTTNVTNYVSETDTLYRNVKTFQGSAGEVKVVAHKDVRNTAGTATMYLINEEMFKVAYYRKPSWKPLATSGDYELGMYLAEFTLESLAEKASAKRTGYKKEAV